MIVTKDSSQLINHLTNECTKFMQSLMELYTPKVNSNQSQNNGNGTGQKKTHKKSKQFKEIQTIDLQNTSIFDEQAFSNFEKVFAPILQQRYPEFNTWQNKRLLEREWRVISEEQRLKYSK